MEKHAEEPILDVDVRQSTSVDSSLHPHSSHQRIVGKVPYMFMWVGDGVNMGNMTLGMSVVVAGTAVLNMTQTIAAAFVAILIISAMFFLNDRSGYKYGIPYVIQLRMAFGTKGTIISALLRGVPAIIWYGVQNWIGGTALNEIAKVFTDGGFDNVPVCFVALGIVQIFLSWYGFKAIKWVEIIASVVILASMIFVFYVMVAQHSETLIENWISVEGTWGAAFFGMIMVFLGNYAAIFLSASDYSRELVGGVGNGKRFSMYFSPILLSYGFILVVGAMAASVTGINNPAKALPQVVNNDFFTVGISLFIVTATIATNMVANIIAPTYVITLLTGVRYRVAVTITGILALGAFPWVLVKDSSSKGLDLFILTYSAFLGPIIAILIIEYFVFRKQKIDLNELYRDDGYFEGYNSNALIALALGAIFAFVINVHLAWIIGFLVAGAAYFMLSRFAAPNSAFKKGTIFEGVGAKK